MTEERVVDERTEILASQVESLGFRALATSHAFASAIPLAPALAVKKALVQYVWEELQRFETASDLYVEIKAGEDLHAVVRPRLAEIRPPATWLEVAVIQFLYDRAGVVQMRELAASSDERVAKLAARILEGERMHKIMGGEGGSALRNMLLTEPDDTPRAQDYFDRWLAESLRSFGRPGSPRSKRAIELGLRQRDSAEVIRDYLGELGPIMKACGLRMPTREQIGLELPDHVGLG
ncbi:MAG TPA: Phenylacetic acid catabolic protein [Kofleriaceae bacterium]|nr:Phenylacetic acid catabolic protein [Kofleriaceae bacterium]